ncbi:MAG: ectoine hydroxylase-related dioxygenase (phytanoyl-CoA dioxygenase family) [Pseudomonadales bacterium]|jgi:ectoine hydroxylase-related dioxygenase (phytanoyl-CoA dioxygenase family)
MSINKELVISCAEENKMILRERFQEYGYLYIKSYVSSENCSAMLNDIITATTPYITLDDKTKLPISNGDPFFETDKIWDDIYPKIQSLESFHSFFHDDHIMEFMKTVSDSDVFVYPMKMARISTPGKIGYGTPPHQDAHSHHAGPTMAGIWVALHDVKKSMGRLKVLPHSHKDGVRNVFKADGVGGVQCEIFEYENTWHVSDVAQGDIIIFHSCCIHKAEPNTAKNAARLSIDTRFCDYGAAVFSTNLEPHHGWRIEGLDWANIYQNWQDNKLQYYWKNYPNLF